MQQWNSGFISLPAESDDGLHSQPVREPGCADARPYLTRLAELGKRQQYRQGALLIQEGDVSDTLYIVQKGRVRVFVTDGKEKQVTLGLYGPGECVGEMSLDGGPRSACVEAAVSGTVCALVPKATLLRFISAEPEFALEMMGRVIHRARQATMNMRNLALLDVYGRLVSVLNDMARLQSDNTRIVIERITHREIANLITCSREMVTRLLRDLEKGGYISMQDRRIVLLKPLPARW